jgi:hypothetical protein
MPTDAASRYLPPETAQTTLERRRVGADGRFWPKGRDAMVDPLAIAERMADDIATLARDDSSTVENWQLEMAGWPSCSVLAHALTAAQIVRARRNAAAARADARSLAAILAFAGMNAGLIAYAYAFVRAI